jgi:hypothetical protein
MALVVQGQADVPSVRCARHGVWGADAPLKRLDLVSAKATLVKTSCFPKLYLDVARDGLSPAVQLSGYPMRPSRKIGTKQDKGVALIFMFKLLRCGVSMAIQTVNSVFKKYDACRGSWRILNQ